MLKLDHVVFPVRDAGRTLAFYRDLLGLPLADALSGGDWGGYPWLMMMFELDGGQQLVTVVLRGAPSPDYLSIPAEARHYALAASSAAELAAWRTRLRSAGVAFSDENHGDQQSIYFADPDGVILEITWGASAGEADPEAPAVVARWLADTAAAPIT